MNKTKIDDASKLFNTSEKWSSFNELISMKGQMQDKWWKGLSSKTALEFQNSPKTGWAYTKWNSWDHKWYLEEFGDDSIGIWMWGGQIGLSNYCSRGVRDFERASEIISSSKYSELLAVFRADFINNNDFLILEKGNFKFGEECDFSPEPGTSYEQLSWYAGNETEEFVRQIAEKVNKIRNDEHLTSLLRELNQEFKK